jgi:hypothetical protein
MSEDSDGRSLPSVPSLADLCVTIPATVVLNSASLEYFLDGMQ